MAHDLAYAMMVRERRILLDERQYRLNNAACVKAEREGWLFTLLVPHLRGW